MPDTRALQAFLRTSAGRGRTVLRVAPFTVTIHPHDPLKYLNYAIPDDAARPDRDAIEAACAAFAAGARLCVLSPGGETAQRVYARAGFRRAATMLYWSDPD